MGFKYNLYHEQLEVGSTLTISNEIVDNVATVRVEKVKFYRCVVQIEVLMEKLI